MDERKYDWSAGAIATLIEMWKDGKSASQIAASLGHGLTRSAVIGKVHHLRISGGAVAPRAPMRPRAAKPAAAPKAKAQPGVARAAPSMPKMRKALLAPLPISIPALPKGGRLTVMYLSDKICRWPIGDPKSPDFCFCGHTPREGGPYCEFHAAQSHQPRDTSKRSFRYG